MRVRALNAISGRAGSGIGLGGGLIAGLIIGLMTASLSLHAQGVYVTRGANGPVFSDKPQPGAKEMQLRPLSVVPAQRLPQESKALSGAAGDTVNDAAKGRAESQTPPQTPYGAFTILFPEQNGSIVANTGSFVVRLAVEPPLKLGEGHAFTIRLNGQPVGQRFTATEFMFPPEFWGGEAPPINQRAQLDASIVDSAGRVIMNAPPTIFLMRYTTALQRPHPLHPPHPPHPFGPPPHPRHRYPPPAPHVPPHLAEPAYIPPWKAAYPRELFPGSRTTVMPPGAADHAGQRGGEGRPRPGGSLRIGTEMPTTAGASFSSSVSR